MDPATQLERLRAALAASGDVAYEWDMAADTVSWLYGAPPAGPSLALATVETGEALHERIQTALAALPGVSEAGAVSSLPLSASSSQTTIQVAGAPGNTGDPDTPYADSVALSQILANGHLITWAGEGHTARRKSA